MSDMFRKKPLTRAQLAAFAPTHEAVKFFEHLQQRSVEGGETTEQVEDCECEISVNEAKINELYAHVFALYSALDSSLGPQNYPWANPEHILGTEPNPQGVFALLPVEAPFPWRIQVEPIFSDVQLYVYNYLGGRSFDIWLYMDGTGTVNTVNCQMPPVATTRDLQIVAFASEARINNLILGHDATDLVGVPSTFDRGDRLSFRYVKEYDTWVRWT